MENKQDQALEASTKQTEKCARHLEAFDSIKRKIKKLEEKDVLGGTTNLEKGGIVIGAIYTLFRLGQQVWIWFRG